MALNDILFGAGDLRQFILELPTVSYSGALSDILSDGPVGYAGEVLEMDALDAPVTTGPGGATITARQVLATLFDIGIGDTVDFPGHPKIKKADGSGNRVEADLDINGNRTRTAFDGT